MGIPFSPDVKANLEMLLTTLRPQVYILDGNIANVGAAGSVPMMAAGIPTPILLPPNFTNAVITALKAQRDFDEKLLNLVEQIYQKMNE
jgi:hypothetical protein